MRFSYGLLLFFFLATFFSLTILPSILKKKETPAEETGKIEATEKTEETEKTEATEKTEETEKTEKTETTEKTDKTEKTEKTDETEDKILNPPKFSNISGFYPENFSLELTSEENAKIYYTLDSSDPKTSNTSKEYKDSILI